MNIRQDWFTPVSEEEYLSFVSATIGKGCDVIVRGSRSKRTWLFKWQNCLAFLNTDEGLRLPWHYSQRQASSGPWGKSGGTHKVTDSSWIKELGELLAHHNPGCQHFCIATDDYWTEVVSEHEPEITEVHE